MIAARESGLNKALTRSQVTMIGLGGAIGTGLFMGSGLAIGYAGPAVVLSFGIAALAAVAIVFSLSEMAVVHPTAGSFGTYAEIYLSPWAGFIVRYSYWMAQVIAIGAEAVAAGVYMTFWFPGTPLWTWSVGFAFVLLYFNSRSVHNFGSIEYWFAMIKVVAIVLFIILGASMIFGLGRPSTGFHNLTGLPGGFMPHGFGGVWMAVLVGSNKSTRPKRARRPAVRPQFSPLMSWTMQLPGQVRSEGTTRPTPLPLRVGAKHSTCSGPS